MHLLMLMLYKSWQTSRLVAHTAGIDSLRLRDPFVAVSMFRTSAVVASPAAANDRSSREADAAAKVNLTYTVRVLIGLEQIRAQLHATEVCTSPGFCGAPPQ